MKILFIDHDDSFSNNSISFFRERHFHVDVRSHNDLHLMQTSFPIQEYQSVILSPGPGSPEEYPQSLEFYFGLPYGMPVLGICLGHQIMLSSSGGIIRQICPRPIHGRQLTVKTQLKSRILGKINLAGSIVLYHSLGCQMHDPIFTKMARNHRAFSDSKGQWHSLMNRNGVCLMAEHVSKPHIGVQFHPESFASSIGVSFLNKFIRFISL